MTKVSQALWRRLRAGRSHTFPVLLIQGGRDQEFRIHIRSDIVARAARLKTGLTIYPGGTTGKLVDFLTDEEAADDAVD